MTTYPPTMIRLSGERKSQLQAVADALGAASLSAAIGQLIGYAQADGLIGHDLPGVKINRLSDGLAVAFDDAIPTVFSPEAAKQLASTIRSFVDGSEKSKCVISMEHDFSVARRGVAFTVTIPFAKNGTTKVWAADVALDFAAMIEREAKRAA
jgi:hypothetical protein